MIIELTKANYESEVINSDIPVVVVEFWGSKCPKCKEFAPAFKELSEDPLYTSKVKFCSVNTDTHRLLAITQKVMSQPTVLIYSQGLEMTRINRDHVSTLSIKAVIQRLVQFDV